MAYGPVYPDDYYDDRPRILECGDSEEDCDGIECGRGPMRPEPEDYEFWKGEK